MFQLKFEDAKAQHDGVGIGAFGGTRWRGSFGSVLNVNRSMCKNQTRGAWEFKREHGAPCPAQVGMASFFKFKQFDLLNPNTTAWEFWFLLKLCQVHRIHQLDKLNL